VGDDVAVAIRDLLTSSGPDAVIDAVGMEAHGSGGAKFAQQLTSLLPDSWTEKLMTRAGFDRLAALQTAIDVVRRGGTISLAGVYGGMTDPLPMMVLFDKQIQVRMGQANVKRWIDDLLPLVSDTDVLQVEDFATHHLPLEDAAHAYEIFQKKQDGAVKVLFQPG
jgi:threonine dehydrogenase-like Zn-dependent dehydrogenase